MAGRKIIKIDPLIVEWEYNTSYKHSYAQDSPFFYGISQGKLIGSECRKCNYRYGTYRKYCMYCGNMTYDFELPLNGKIHSFTTCNYAGEVFKDETPYTLILVQFENVNSLFMSRLVNKEKRKIEIGMDVVAKFKKTPDFTINDVYFVPA